MPSQSARRGYPSVPIVFAETRALAQEWTYRFLAAARHEVSLEGAAAGEFQSLAPAGPVPPAPEKPRRARRPAQPGGQPDTARVRAWAVAQGLDVADRGRLRPEIWAAWAAREDAQHPG